MAFGRSPNGSSTRSAGSGIPGFGGQSGGHWNWGGGTRMLGSEQYQVTPMGVSVTDSDGTDGNGVKFTRFMFFTFVIIPAVLQVAQLVAYFGFGTLILGVDLWGFAWGALGGLIFSYMSMLR